MRQFNAGWDGSAHNKKILRNSEIHIKKGEYFSLIEWFLGDSKYTNKNFYISTYKKPTKKK